MENENKKPDTPDNTVELALDPFETGLEAICKDPKHEDIPPVDKQYLIKWLRRWKARVPPEPQIDLSLWYRPKDPLEKCCAFLEEGMQLICMLESRPDERVGRVFVRKTLPLFILPVNPRDTLKSAPFVIGGTKPFEMVIIAQGKFQEQINRTLTAMSMVCNIDTDRLMAAVSKVQEMERKAQMDAMGKVDF